MSAFTLLRARVTVASVALVVELPLAKLMRLVLRSSWSVATRISTGVSASASGLTGVYLNRVGIPPT